MLSKGQKRRRNERWAREAAAAEVGRPGTKGGETPKHIKTDHSHPHMQNRHLRGAGR